ncbi:unnamed protein product [Schistosoma margrebowiei]|uniref:Uncharacterized protein n=1 Tax=Schistosoma margrebowiei TaxID=48269 RepID=A0AA85AML9_9TREM|nr:unnamed protein product [Schistosoma margrebowiei]
MELNPYRRYCIIQFILLLDLNYISERVLVILSNNDLDHVNWSHILQLISVMITCNRGGVSTVKFMIHQLLLSLFNSNMNYINNDNVDLDCLHLLDDVFIHKSQLDVLKSNKHDKQLLIGVLLIARQLCSEDNRLTGINYKQWWMETFSNPLLSTHNNTQNVLSSRCAVVYFCDLLIGLLPWETDPKFLQIQVNTRPNWFNPVKRSMNNNRIKIHTDKIRVKPTEVIMSFNEDELIMPIDLECTNMITDNHNHNTYIESCINRWNDYCEIAQGRLAELRVRWNTSWLDDTMIMYVNHVSTYPFKCTRPLLALLNAPETEHLSDELKFAREQLLQGIRSAGLSHLLNHTKEKTSTTKMITKTTTTTKRKKKRPTCTTQRSSTSKQYRMSNKSEFYNETNKT